MDLRSAGSGVGALLAAFLVCGLPRVQAFGAAAPLNTFSMTMWNHDDGLPSRVFSITQDRAGYLWLGTGAGLMRFDGVRFQRWSDLGLPSLTELAVNVVAEGRDGSLWVGFHGGVGVSRIRDGRAQHYREPQGLMDGYVTFIFEDRRGVVWLGSRGGLFRFKDESWERIGSERGLSDGAAYSGYEDRHGNLWIGTSLGVFRRREGAEEFALADAAHDFVQRFSEDSSGILWLTDRRGGFTTLEPSRRRDPPLRLGSSFALLHDRRGNMWVGTLGQGLWLIPGPRGSPGGRAPNSVGLVGSGVRSLFEDRDGNIWVGADTGLYRLTSRKVLPITNVGLSRHLEATPDGSVWVGTPDELVEFNGSVQRRHGTAWGVPDLPVTGMFTDRQGTLWIAANRRLARRTHGRVRPVVLPPDVPLSRITSLASDSKGVLWLCDVDTGVYRWQSGRLTPYRPPPGAGTATFVYIDRRDGVWIAFGGGFLVSLAPDGAERVYGPADGLGPVLNAIYEDSATAIWLGGTHGLSRIVRGDLSTVGRARGLPGPVLSIVEDTRGDLWIGVASGIVRLKRQDFVEALMKPSVSLHYELFDTSDGLSGTPLRLGLRSAVRGRDGKLWFSTAGGLTMVDPDTLADQPRPSASPVVIQSVWADEQPVNPVRGAVLRPGTSRLHFEYAALNLTSPAKMRFRHRLEGLDDGWIDADTRRDAVYANMSAGHYTFHVAATDGDDTSTESLAVWEFSIAPTFYETRQFYAACGVSLVLLLWLAWRMRVRQMHAQFSLALAERARLSREIHDTLLQGMVGVSLQLDVLSTSAHGPTPPGRQELVRIRRELQECIREARQSIGDLRSPSLRTRDFPEALRSTVERLAGRSVVTVTGTPRPCSPRVAQHLLRIAQEATLNALHHAAAKHIKVSLCYTAESIVLEVRDDGSGFDVEAALEADGHFGLSTMRERAEDAGGQLSIETRPGAGTAVQVVVPHTHSSRS